MENSLLMHFSSAARTHSNSIMWFMRSMSRENLSLRPVLASSPKKRSNMIRQRLRLTGFMMPNLMYVITTYVMKSSF